MSSKVIATPAAIAAALAFLFIGYLNVRIDAFPTGAEVGIPQIDALSAKIKSGARQFLETGAQLSNTQTLMNAALALAPRTPLIVHPFHMWS